MQGTRALGMILAAAILVAACSREPAVTVEEFGFFGEIVEYQGLDTWSVSSDFFTIGGPQSELKVGPTEFLLSTGVTVSVPPSTRGGNLCDPLAGYSDPTVPDECVILGEWASDGVAAWFGLVPGGDVIVQDGARYVSLQMLEVKGENGIVRTGFRDISLPLANEIENVGCFDLPDGYIPLSGFALSSSGGSYALINLETTVIEKIDCGYEG